MRFSFDKYYRLSTTLIQLGLVSLILAGGPGAEASTVTLDFEGFSDTTLLTTQYPGITFANAIILTSGISLNEFEFPPQSGVNVVSDNGGAITIDFANPITSFAGYFTYLKPLTLAGFDISGTEVASAMSEFSTNDALYGDAGSSPNEFISVSFTGGMSTVTISGDPVGSSFALDDSTYAASAAPEPGGFLLFTALAVAATLCTCVSKTSQRHT